MLQPDILCVYDATKCYGRAFAAGVKYPLKFARKMEFYFRKIALSHL